MVKGSIIKNKIYNHEPKFLGVIKKKLFGGILL